MVVLVYCEQREVPIAKVPIETDSEQKWSKMQMGCSGYTVVCKEKVTQPTLCAPDACLGRFPFSYGCATELGPTKHFWKIFQPTYFCQSADTILCVSCRLLG